MSLLGKKTSLFDTHVRLGAQLTDFAGWQMPTRYSSELDEHRAVRSSAGLFDLSHMAEIVVLGAEAARSLDHALAGSFLSMPLGRAKYSLLLAREGGIIDDVVVYRTGDDRFMIVANAANHDVVLHELVDRTAPFDVEVFDETDDIALVAVQGPAAQKILEATPSLAADAGQRGGNDFSEKLAALRYYRSMPAYFGDTAILIARTGYTGEDGFELFVSPGIAEQLWQDLTEAGADYGLVPAGLASRDTLRLEAGMPLYGNEISLDTAPSQAGLGRVVDMSKQDFVGRESLEEETPMGLPVLVGLRGSGKRAARKGYNLFLPESDEKIGTVTSGALSPTLEVPVAMAYVHPEHGAPGTELHVDVRGTRIPFTVTELPFYKRRKDNE